MGLLAKTFGRHRIVLVALDQGLEHGPIDFSDENIDARKIVGLLSPHADAFMLNKGIALLASKELKCGLVLKLSGKTGLSPQNNQAQIASVEDAVALKARAVAQTVYVGSEFEEEMLAAIGRTQTECRKKKIPLMGIMYPRGPKITDPYAVENVAYAARVGAEVGADFVKTYWTGSALSFKKVIDAADGVPVLVAGGKKSGKKDFYAMVKEAMISGARGMAVGRNVWQDDKPLEVLNKVKKIVYSDKY